MLLTKEQIFACEDIRSKVVNIPQWKGDVKIRVMSIADQIEFEALNKDKKSDTDIIFAMLSLCCIDNEGNKLFDKKDLPEIKKKSSAVILKLFKECLDLNSLNEKDLDIKAKNS